MILLECTLAHTVMAAKLVETTQPLSRSPLRYCCTAGWKKAKQNFEMEQAWVLLCTLPRALFILKSNQGLHIKTECVDITRKHIHSTRSKTILYVTCQSWVHLLKQGSCLLNLYSCSILNPFPCKLQRVSPQSCKGDPCAGTWFCVGAILLERLPQEETVLSGGGNPSSSTQSMHGVVEHWACTTEQVLDTVSSEAPSH